MEYTILFGSMSNQPSYDVVFSNLIENVNEYIQSGWKPQGGVSGRCGFLIQAMVKEKP
jgi:hypothetical protein